MTYLHHILSRALNDQFQPVANPIKLAHEFCAGLWPLARAANRAFEKSDPSVGSAFHLVMDMNEAALNSILRPDPKSHVFFLTLHDDCQSDLRKFFAPLPEPGLILTFSERGAVTAMTTKNPLPDEYIKKIKPARTETCRVTDQNRLEEMIAAWLRVNLDAKTMVAIQEELNRQEEHEMDSLTLWSPEQLKRMQNPAP